MVVETSGSGALGRVLPDVEFSETVLSFWAFPTPTFAEYGPTVVQLTPDCRWNIAFVVIDGTKSTPGLEQKEFDMKIDTTDNSNMYESPHAYIS